MKRVARDRGVAGRAALAGRRHEHRGQAGRVQRLPARRAVSGNARRDPLGGQARAARVGRRLEPQRRLHGPSQPVRGRPAGRRRPRDDERPARRPRWRGRRARSPRRPVPAHALGDLARARRSRRCHRRPTRARACGAGRPPRRCGPARAGPPCPTARRRRCAPTSSRCASTSDAVADEALADRHHDLERPAAVERVRLDGEALRRARFDEARPAVLLALELGDDALRQRPRRPARPDAARGNSSASASSEPGHRRGAGAIGAIGAEDVGRDARRARARPVAERERDDEQRDERRYERRAVDAVVEHRRP